MIMAAGLGTRLQPLTGPIPKPMVPVVNRPAMEHILRLLTRHGITEVVVNLHHLPDQITGHFGDGAAWGVGLRYSFEERLLGTAGGVKNNEAFLGGGTFLVMSGDSLTDVDLTGVLRAHRTHGAIATLVVREVDDPSEYGVAVLDPDGRVTGFQEKPSREEALSNLCNCGIYVFEPAVLDRIPAGEFYDFGRAVFPELLEDRIPFFAHVTHAYWNDVGSVPAYRRGCLDALAGEVTVEVPGTEVRPGVWLGAGTRIAEGAVIHPPAVIGGGCVIEAGAVLSGPLTLGDGCVVRGGAGLSRSVLWNGVSVGPDARIRDGIIAGGVRIGRGVRVEGAVIGDGSVVRDGTDLGAAVLDPGTVVGAA